MEINNKTMSDFLSCLSDRIGEENKEIFNKIINLYDHEIDSAESFYFSKIYAWEKFIDGYLKHSFKNNNTIYIYKNYYLLYKHLTRLFETHEGSACCADKARTILNVLIDYFEENKQIQFNYDSEYTYHLPKLILKNQEDVLEYYDSLIKLFSGNVLAYIEKYNKIIINKLDII